jgi:hypothetical protein
MDPLFPKVPWRRDDDGMEMKLAVGSDNDPLCRLGSDRFGS